MFNHFILIRTKMLDFAFVPCFPKNLHTNIHIYIYLVITEVSSYRF